MRKIITLILALSLICSLSLTAFADEVTEPVTSPAEPSETPAEPSEPETESPAPSEQENPSEEPSEPSEPSSEPVEEEATDPQDPGATEPEEPAEPETPTVNISEQSIQAIADAIVDDTGFTLNISGNTVHMERYKETHQWYNAQQSFFNAWETYPYKAVVWQGEGMSIMYYFWSEKPAVADYVDSSGRYNLKDCTAYGYGSVNSDTKITINTWKDSRYRSCQVYPHTWIWSNFHVIGQDGVVIHESDVPIVNWISFNTGFDDLVIDRMSSVMFNAPTPVYEGYQFDGWYLDSEFTQPYTPDYIFAEDTTLYAKWVPYVTITVVTGLDDYVVEPIKVLAGQVFHLPGFSYPNHRFKGAYTSEGFEASSQFYSGTVVEEDTTLYLWFEAVDNVMLMEMILERLEGLVYVQMASIIMLIAGVIASVFFIRRNS